MGMHVCMYVCINMQKLIRAMRLGGGNPLPTWEAPYGPQKPHKCKDPLSIVKYSKV